MLHKVAPLLVIAVASTAAAAELPNIILVLGDDIGWSDVGYNNVTSKMHEPGAGGTNWRPNPPRTPHLDAMAAGPNTMLFNRFYAGSGVCSPTRSAMLTGRTPDRECIFGAEGCGQKPAWSCADTLPLPPPTFTVAEAAKKAGYATTHIGKWHLGDFFPMKKRTRKTVVGNEWVDVEVGKGGGYAYGKWPVSHPGLHGFDEWHSTEASASSSTCNCACEENWLKGGCISGGGGGWGPKPPGDCTNYWSPTDLSNATHVPTRPECHGATTSTRDCVFNLTSKIGATRVAPDTGDDTEHILNVFEDFLRRKADPKSEEHAPFLAALWLHTNHEPHPALPQYYYAYNDTYGDPAGDYLGTLTQMDVQIGRLRQMLKDHGVADNTLLWFTTDNGPHEGVKDVRASTNGLRQCKASLFEGGIRVPGMIEWPAVIKRNVESDAPANVYDVLPTVLDIIGMPHEHPTWAADGMSLLPRLKGQVSASAPRPAARPLCFKLGDQAACIDNDWKIVSNPSKGQCDWNDPGNKPPPFGTKGPYLFNLKDDPTESTPLNAKQPALFANYSSMLSDFIAGIVVSQQNESTCLPIGPSPSPSTPTPAPAPVGPDPPAAGFFLKLKSGDCLRGGAIGQHTDLFVGACDSSSKWQSDAKAGGALVNVADPSLVAKALAEGVKDYCKTGEEVFFGKTGGGNQFSVSAGAAGAVTLPHENCKGMCLAYDASKGRVMLDDCAAQTSMVWLQQ